jgi:cell division protein FtsW (lipid II flippase)
MKKWLPPEAFEWAFTLAAIAFLASQAEAFRDPEFPRGAGDRYRKAIELSVPVEAASRLAPTEAPTLEALTKAREAFERSLAQPVKAKLARLDELENRAREARAETDVQGAIEGLTGETSLYREAYGLANGRSLPLDCAWTHLENAGALANLGALLEGDAPKAMAGAPEAWSKAAREAGCASLGSPRKVLTQAAELVATARGSENNAAKSQAAHDLLLNAYWVYGLWAVAGLALVQIGRFGLPARLFLPLAAMVWAALGWLTQVHVEWLNDRTAQTATLMKWGLQGKAFFQVAAVAAGLLLMLGIVMRRHKAVPPSVQTPSSRLGYAGFVLFVGLGWWLLLDLSATGHYANRFHALYQQVYVFAAFVLLTFLSPVRLRLAGRLGQAFGRFLLFARPRGTGVRRYLPWLVYAGAAVGVLAAASFTRRSQTQLTSEIFRLWLVFGASWFFLVRGEAALALSARTGAAGGAVGKTGNGLLRGLVFLAPLAFILCVPVAGFMITDDFGPLFVMLYGASIFFGAAFAFAFFDLAGYRRWLGSTVGVAVAGAWVYLITYALYSLPAPLARIAERLATVRSPFTATNDQLAIITWFQESAPLNGYGLGSVPWCGENATGGCAVPRQVQSDYVFTAFVGVYGKVMALALVALLAFWLVRLVVHHSRATRGVVELGSPVVTHQAWLSWIAVCWVGLTLAQLVITVAGNLGWLPLTGITFPFASFGAWSLLANTFFLGLAISLPRRTA